MANLQESKERRIAGHSQVANTQRQRKTLKVWQNVQVWSFESCSFDIFRIDDGVTAPTDLSEYNCVLGEFVIFTVNDPVNECVELTYLSGE